MVVGIQFQIWTASVLSALLLTLIARNQTNTYQPKIFGLGIIFNLTDILTTWVNLYAFETASETNQVTVLAMNTLGPAAGLVAKFLALLLVFYVIWRVAKHFESAGSFEWVAGWIVWFWFFLGFYPTLWNLQFLIF